MATATPDVYRREGKEYKFLAPSLPTPNAGANANYSVARTDRYLAAPPPSEETLRREHGTSMYLPFLRAAGPPFSFAAAVPRYLARLHPVVREYYHTRVHLPSEEACWRLANCQQGTPEWLQSRRDRFTSSDFDKFLGTHAYVSKEDALRVKIHGEVRGPGRDGRARKSLAPEEKKVYDKVRDQERTMARGSYYEDFARKNAVAELAHHLRRALSVAALRGDSQVLFLERRLTIPERLRSLDAVRAAREEDLVSVQCRGLTVLPEAPFLGGSSDGEITLLGCHQVGIFEFKVPKENAPYAITPLYQYTQYQTNMFFHKVDLCIMESWSAANGRQQALHIYHPEYCMQYVFPQLTETYFTEFLPQLVRAALEATGVPPPAGSLLLPAEARNEEEEEEAAAADER